MAIPSAPVIYLDNNATTRVRAEVADAMADAVARLWGNPSSLHAPGRAARDAVEHARAEVAALVGATPEEIVFTSGGTEGDHLAIRGLARAARKAGRGARIVTSPLEHPAVLGAVESLCAEGFSRTLVGPNADGQIDPIALADALGDAVAKGEAVALVTLAAVNHEPGNAYPVEAFSLAARSARVLFHTDAVQAAGRVSLALGAAGVDAATISAHKLYGPKGVGAIFIQRGAPFEALSPGGHQERERRAGTENVGGIVGFGVACRLARAELASSAAAIGALRDRLEAALLAIPGARRHGAAADRVPGTLNVGFEGADGQLVVIGLDLEGVCVSTGAACTSGSVRPSSVLLGLGLPPERAREAIRFSLGRETTAEDVERVAALVPGIVARVRRG